MRRTRSAPPEAAELARRRLALLSAELAAARPDADQDAPWPPDGGEQAWTPETGDLPRWDAGGGPGGSTPTEATAPTTRRRPAEAPEPEVGRHVRHRSPASARVAGWLADRLPTSWQGRVRLSGSHVVVLAALAIIAVAVSGWYVRQTLGSTTPVSAPASAPVSAPVSAGAPGTAAVATPAPSISPLATSAPIATTDPAGAPSPAVGSTGVVVVDVAGKVARPGIVTLPTGSRVADALEAAGGARRGVGLRSLNLARVLVDGEQVAVGFPAVTGVAASAVGGVVGGATGGAAGPTSLVNLNTATPLQLEELPGVGPVTAAAIVAFRTEHGPFSSVDELLEVSGIGEVTLAEIAPMATL